MVAAVSTACLYPLETEKALQTLINLGVRTFEIFINSESEMNLSFLRPIGKNLAANNARIYSMHLHTSAFEPMMFFSDYPRRFDDSLNRYGEYFFNARNIGASVVVFHGDRKEGRISAKLYYDRFALLADKAKKEGVTLAQENVSRCKSRDIGFVKNMREYLGNGNVKFVLDCKQAIRSQTNPLEMLSAMGSDIINVHISDSNAERDCMLPGRGTFDFKRLIASLTEFGYNGPLVVEVYRSDFGQPSELMEAYSFVRSLL